MKFGQMTKHTVAELHIDWFNPCCFTLITFNVELHNKKFWIEGGLFGITALFVADWSQDLLKNLAEDGKH